MKILRCFLLVSAVLPLFATIGQAKGKAVYQTGKLIDLRSYETGAGASRAQRSFCLAIQVEDISYLVRYESFLRGNYEPTNLIVGDPMQIRIKDDSLYFRTGKKERSTRKNKPKDISLAGKESCPIRSPQRAPRL